MPAGFASILRRHVAPPRFVMFATLLAGFFVVATLAGVGLNTALLVSFDAATLAFLVSIISLLNDDTATMRATSAKNDANRVGLLAITIVVLAVVLIAIGTLVAHRGSVWFEVPLILGSLAFAWIFSNSIFALHYTHLFYLQADGRDRGGLAFPDAEAPDYWDFFYFSFTLGMTFQTSDVVIKDGHMRRVVLAQSIAAFLFNLGVLAFAINTIGSL